MGSTSHLHTLTHTGAYIVTAPPNIEKKNVDSHGHPPHKFPRPSIFRRIHLMGILYTLSDMIFLASLYFTWVWVLVRLHFIELPFHILTGFNYSSKQHPASWPWWSSVFFAVVRAGAIKCQTMGQIRVTGLLISTFMPLQLFFTNNVKVTKNVKFKVKLDALLRHERVTLKDLREELHHWGHSDDPLNPSPEYLESMHPSDPDALANLPEEVGAIDPDGTYTLQCEWIEALDPDHHDPRPMSKTVIMYFHGGAHVFCSTASHRHMLAQLAKDVGPGTRVFSVGYRLAPEHPFPAAIHDAFAAYLYLTEPKHEALVLDEKSAAKEMAVDPRDLVVAGDSAGGNLAVAFMQYMNKYVQPSVQKEFVLPHATILLSPWTDVTSSLPAAQSFDWYCYCPGPIGTPPFDKKQYIKNKKQNYASLYVCGEAKFVPNCRNALGMDRRWEWYTHLVQHPLVSVAFSSKGSLNGMGNTLVQAATHDRLVDDSRLIAHRIGVENKNQLVRIEVYKHMVHVHQFMFFLFGSGRVAFKNIAHFIERSYQKREQEELKAAKPEGRIDGANPERSYAAVVGEGTTSAEPAPSYAAVVEGGAAATHHEQPQAVLRKPHVPEQEGKPPAPEQEEDDNDDEEPREFPTSDTPSDDYDPKYISTTGKSWADGVEWILVEQDGRQAAGDEGVPLSLLKNAWGTDDDGADDMEKEE